MLPLAHPPVRLHAKSYSPDVDDVCETVWKMIVTARVRGNRDVEAGLKNLARAFDCSARPETVELREYPELDDIDAPTPPPFSEQWYRVGYQLCSMAPAQIMADAGTDDVRQAATWVAENGAAADASGRAGLFQGCFDALSGDSPLPSDA